MAGIPGISPATPLWMAVEREKSEHVGILMQVTYLSALVIVVVIQDAVCVGVSVGVVQQFL